MHPAHETQARTKNLARPAPRRARSAITPVTPDLETRPLSTLVPRYECPACESVVPADCVQHRFFGEAADRRTSAIACPRCDQRHKADFVRIFDQWVQVSETVPVSAEARLDEDVAEAHAAAEYATA